VLGGDLLTSLRRLELLYGGRDDSVRGSMTTARLHDDDLVFWKGDTDGPE